MIIINNIVVIYEVAPIVVFKTYGESCSMLLGPKTFTDCPYSY
jgi:hypothetical protein